MGDGFNILEILLLAMVAGFIVLRLRSVLGKRTGAEPRPPVPPPYSGRSPEADKGPGNVIPLPGRANQPEADTGPAAAGLARIRAADPRFDTAEFIGGAKGAYEMIVTAFAKGDVAMLRTLLGDEVYRSFAAAIEQRQASEETQETTLVSIKEADVVDADLTGGRMAEVTIRFVSELISVTRDKNGEVVAGNPNAVEETTDIWTFSRNVRSSDPNWQLIATATPT